MPMALKPSSSLSLGAPRKQLQGLADTFFDGELLGQLFTGPLDLSTVITQGQQGMLDIVLALACRRCICGAGHGAIQGAELAAQLKKQPLRSFFTNARNLNQGLAVFFFDGACQLIGGKARQDRQGSTRANTADLDQFAEGFAFLLLTKAI